MELIRLRYLHDDQVQTYNILREIFLTNIVASIFGFREREYIQFGEEIEQRPSTKVY